MRVYYVYILTNRYNTVLYTGVTGNLSRRCFEHKTKQNPGFTSKYNVDKLIYYEMFAQVEAAIKREKQIKKYSREKKENLISCSNPFKRELYHSGVVDHLPQNFSKP